MYIYLFCSECCFLMYVNTQACVICKLVHGSCIQCSMCTTRFHATCASHAGYYMEVSNINKLLFLPKLILHLPLFIDLVYFHQLHCIEKNGMQIITNWTTYCAAHRYGPALSFDFIRTFTESS